MNLNTLVAVLTLACCITAGAWQSRPAIDPVQELVDQAAGAPAEYRADVLLRVLESGKLTGRATQRKAVVQDILQAATALQQPIARVYAGRLGENRATRRAVAYRLGLDTVSVRMRVVRSLLTTDVNQAWEVFRDTSLDLPPLSCHDALVYDFAPYYETLRQLLDYRRTSYADRDEVLGRALGSVNYAGQIAPVARLLSTSKSIAAEQRDTWIVHFTGRLPYLRATKWEMLAYEHAGEMSSAVQALSTIAESPAAVVQAFRSMLERSIKAEDPCHILLGSTAATFNTSLRRHCGESCPELQGNATTETLRREVHADAEPLPPNTPFRGMLKPLLDLESDGAGSAASTEWQQSISRFIDTIERWLPRGTRGNTCPECVFHAKATMYAIFVDNTPPGTYGRRVIDSFITFLEDDPTYASSPIEWLSEAELLLRMVRDLDESGKKRAEELSKQGLRASFGRNREADYILQRLTVSRNPALALYRKAEAVVPKPLDLPPAP